MEANGDGESLRGRTARQERAGNELVVIHGG